MYVYSDLMILTGKATEGETKSRVTAIHELKEQVKKESDNLKEVKRGLKDIQDRQKREKEVCCLDLGSFKFLASRFTKLLLFILLLLIILYE